MTAESRANGAARLDLLARIRGWVIALTPGGAVIGLPVYRGTPGRAGEVDPLGPHELSPVFSFAGMIAPQFDRNRQPIGFAPEVQVLPLFGLVSIDRLSFPPHTPIVPIDGLHEKERGMLAHAVARAIEMQRAFRAELSGITLVSPGAQLPPLPGETRQ
jgi:hypothetical protein